MPVQQKRSFVMVILHHLTFLLNENNKEEWQTHYRWYLCSFMITCPQHGSGCTLRFLLVGFVVPLSLVT